MRSIIEDIMYDRRTDLLSLPLRVLLRIVSTGYSLVISLRNIFYNRRIFKVLDVPCRVISIGNIVVGGSGKTPVTLMTAKLLRDAGFSVAVVSRGYKSGNKKPLVVSDGDRVLVSPPDAGDEPHIIAASLRDVPVVIGVDRVAAAQLAYDRFKPDVIVLDDALQHRRLYRDIDIVTVDADNPLGSNYLVPRGTLREPHNAINRAKVVVVTRVRDDHNRARIERMIRYHAREINLFWSSFLAVGVRKPGAETAESHDVLRGKNVAALSNIANPDSFCRILESLGAVVVVQFALPDHHRYTESELAALEKRARDAGAEFLVMTAKDERNIPDHSNSQTIEKLVLDIQAALEEEKEEYMKIIAPKTKRARK